MTARKRKATTKPKKTAAPKPKPEAKTGRTEKGTFASGWEGGPGRDTNYTDELGQKIAKLLSDGLTVNQIARMEGMPGGSTIRGWALNAELPFYALYTRGRELSFMKMADDMIDIIDDGRNDWMAREMAKQADDEPAKVAWQFNGEHVARSKLRAEKRQWLLSKALPKIYGDKLSAELTGKDGKDLIPETDNSQLARALLDASPEIIEVLIGMRALAIPNKPNATVDSYPGTEKNAQTCESEPDRIYRFDPTTGKLVEADGPN